MSRTQVQHPLAHHSQQRFQSWRDQGLSSRAAGALAISNCDSIEQITRLGREYFEQLPNCAAKTLDELADLANWPAKPVTAVEAIAAALLLSIHDHNEAREAATDALIALRRSGFLVVASKTAPGR